MKTLIILMAVVFLTAAASANPIYMRYDDIGGASYRAEVRGGKAKAVNMKPGTYKVSIVYTGADMNGPDGKPRANGHVKVFDGRTEFAGGVHVAAGDVNGDAMVQKVIVRGWDLKMKSPSGTPSMADIGQKATLENIRFTLSPNRTNTELSGHIGTIQIEGPNDGKKSADTFFDVFTELAFQ